MMEKIARVVDSRSRIGSGVVCSIRRGCFEFAYALHYTIGYALCSNRCFVRRNDRPRQLRTRCSPEFAHLHILYNTICRSFREL